MQTLTIFAEDPRRPDAVALLEAAEASAALLYPPESRHGLDVAAIVAQGVRFFLARVEGRAVGCCGYLPDRDGTAELKRLFVREDARGQGVAAALLTHAENAAQAEGAVRMRLETGIHSHAALALYRRFGYRERGPFGHYRPDPLSVFMECHFMERRLA